MTTSKSIGEITVSEIMTQRVETLTPFDTIKEAVSLMIDCGLSTVPVVDQHNKCIGILSRSDLTEMFMQEDDELAHVLDTDRLSLHWLNRSLDTIDSRVVKELMTYDVALIRSDQALSDVCKTMAKHKIHHVPVVGDENEVVGIVSAYDIVLAVAKLG